MAASAPSSFRVKARTRSTCISLTSPEAFVDPERGDLIARWTWRDSVPAFLFELHAHLLEEDAGKTVNGIGALFMLFLTLTGIILWWPRKSSAFRLRRALAARSAGRAAAFARGIWRDRGDPDHRLCRHRRGHRVLHARQRGAERDVRPSDADEAGCGGRKPSAIGERPWAERLAHVRATFPEGDLVMYSPGRGKNAAQSFRLRLPGEWHRMVAAMCCTNPYDGAVVQSIDARRQGLGTRIAHAIYPVHAATIGGIPYLLFTIVSAVGLALARDWRRRRPWIQKYRATRRARATAPKTAAAAVRTAARLAHALAPRP